MNFWEWLKFSYGTQAIELLVLGVIFWAVKRWRRKHPPKMPAMSDFPLNRCSVENCRLGAGHVMPCWDGTPDPNYKARTGLDKPLA